MFNKRNNIFSRVFFIVFVTLLVSSILIPTQSQGYSIINDHPRIFLTPTNLSLFKTRAATTHLTTYTVLKNWCDTNWGNVDSQAVHFGDSSLLEITDSGVLRYALIYQLGNISGVNYSHSIQEYGQQTVLIIMHMIAYDHGSVWDDLMAVATAYDWVYPLLSISQKQSIVDWFQTKAGTNPFIGDGGQMFRWGYRSSEIPKCLYPVLAFYGDGYKQSLADTYWNFIVNTWLGNDAKAMFHEAGKDGGHPAGTEYSTQFYPIQSQIAWGLYALYTSTNGLLDDFFGTYSFVNGWADWVLHNLQPGPILETAYPSTAKVPLNRIGDMNCMHWNLQSNERAFAATMRVLGQVANEKSETNKAQWIQWMIDSLLGITNDTTFEIIFNPKVAAVSPQNLGIPTVKAFGWNEASGVIDSYLTLSKAGMGQVSMRSSWSGLGESSSSSTYANFNAPPFNYMGHQHSDALNFSIWKGETLALGSAGFYFPTYEGTKIDTSGAGFPHHWLYYKRGLGGNILLILDPNEVINTVPSELTNQFNPIDGGQKAYYDGSPVWGNISVNSPYDMGGLIKYEDTSDYTYSSGDATKAYNAIVDGVEYVNRGGSPKVSLVQRDFVYLKSSDGNSDYFVVFDRVASTSQTYKKAFLLHSTKEPILNGSSTRIYGSSRGGLYLSTNTDTITLTGTSGKLFWKILWPSESSIYKMGGFASSTTLDGLNSTDGATIGGPKINIRVADSTAFPNAPIVTIDGGSYTEAFMCDSKNDSNNTLVDCIRGGRYFEGGNNFNPPTTHPMGANVTQCYGWMYREPDTGKWICHPTAFGKIKTNADYLYGASNHFGLWTTRVETATNEFHSNLLNVLHPTVDLGKTSMAETILIDGVIMLGVLIKDPLNQRVVMFPKGGGGMEKALTYQVNHTGTAKHLIAGLEGGYYDIYINSIRTYTQLISTQNILNFEASGSVKVEIVKSGEAPDRTPPAPPRNPGIK